MTFFQAFLLALFGWMGSIYSPVLIGGLAGWYTIGRPLVSGMIIGLILGDVQTGIIMGAAIQMLYIGLVTPGGTMPADVNFAAWIGIPLAMVAGAGKEYALALCRAALLAGRPCRYTACAPSTCTFVHKQDADVESGKLDACRQDSHRGPDHQLRAALLPDPSHQLLWPGPHHRPCQRPCPSR
jgi:PTS system mannose-specific IIC component